MGGVLRAALAGKREWLVRQHRTTERKAADDEAALRADITNLAKRYGRYGYRRITALLRAQGWSCNHKRWSGSGGLRG
ncbi:MAG: integrase [Rhodospirillales bacterium]|jgi:hypothetical protein|nr:integrase [Rhodospirillales bacterium]MDB5382665.1 integrase [Rhodospirillales bacterium]